MNKIITGLTLLASLGLAGISSQAYAGERGHQRDDHNYTYSNDHDEHHDYRKGYRDARRDVRKHRRAKHHQRHTARYCQNRHRDHYRQNHRNEYSKYDAHSHVRYRHSDNWRVVFKF